MTASDLGGFLSQQPLLALTICAILAVAASHMMAPELRQTAGFLRGAGYLGMLAAVLLTVAQAAYHSPRSEAALILAGKPKLSITGSETRIPMGPDGHFWVDAQVNGVTQRFLIDTGATFTGLGETAAKAAGVERDPMAMPMMLNTANGTITAYAGTIAALEFGTIAVRDLKVAVAPDTAGDINVIGMNLLSRLASWRVEGQTLVLVPKQGEH